MLFVTAIKSYSFRPYSSFQTFPDTVRNCSPVAECLAPISVYLFYYIAELVLVLNMYNIFSAGFDQPTNNQSIIYMEYTLLYTPQSL